MSEPLRKSFFAFGYLLAELIKLEVAVEQKVDVGVQRAHKIFFGTFFVACAVLVRMFGEIIVDVLLKAFRESKRGNPLRRQSVFDPKIYIRGRKLAVADQVKWRAAVLDAHCGSHLNVAAKQSSTATAEELRKIFSVVYAADLTAKQPTFNTAELQAMAAQCGQITIVDNLTKNFNKLFAQSLNPSLLPFGLNGFKELHIFFRDEQNHVVVRMPPGIGRFKIVHM